MRIVHHRPVVGVAHRHNAARLEYPVCLAEYRHRVGKVLQKLVGVDHVEGVVSVLQVVDVAYDEGRVRGTPALAIVFCPGYGFGSGVDAHDDLNPLRKVQRNRAGPAAEVEQQVGLSEMGEQESCAVGGGPSGVIVDNCAEVSVGVLLAHSMTLMTRGIASVRYVIEYGWRGQIDNDALNRLHADAFGHGLYGDDWRTQTARHSLGWVTAYDGDRLVGFLNVPWDGGVHAWLQDVIVASTDRRRGIGRAMVALATENSRTAGCEWLHVDFDEEHREFYVGACGFTPSGAGLIEL